MHFTQTLRYSKQNNARNIKYMAVLFFWKTSILNKMLILRQPPGFKFCNFFPVKEKEKLKTTKY